MRFTEPSRTRIIQDHPNGFCRRRTVHGGSPRLISQTREREHLTPTGRLDWDEEVDCCRTERGRTPVGSIRAVVYHCSVDVGRIGV